MAKFLIFLVLIFALLLILIIILSLLFRRTNQSQRSGKMDLSVEPKVNPTRGVMGPDLHTDFQRQAMLETYPALKDPPYISLLDSSPQAFRHPIDENFLIKVKERFADQKPLFMKSGDLLNLLRNPDSNLGEITSMVSTNPLFSAKILQVVNSAFFGFRDKIDSVGRAITLLGYTNVKSLVLQDYINNIIPKDKQGNAEMYAKIWIHSAIVAACSGYFGQNIFKFSQYEFGTIGLLHDIGKYFLPSMDPLAEAAPGLAGITQEEQVYGLNHAILGGIIAENWELSDSIINCIRYHHHPFFLSPDSLPETYRKQSFVLALSDLVAKVLGYAGNDGDLFPILDEYYQMFGLTPELHGIITPSLVKELEKARITVLSYIQTTAP
ncbi:MAG: hypothetical protein C0407_03160 [Desulfobacca sp.]|nr:hypothetical protein [Desulfobacca sp.]